MKIGKEVVLLVSFGIAALGITLFARFAMWPGLTLSVQAQTIQNVLAPLILTAGFIERAVEVVIAPWRDPDADKLHGARAAALTTDQVAVASDALDAYKGRTKQYALLRRLRSAWLQQWWECELYGRSSTSKPRPSPTVPTPANITPSSWWM